MTSPRWLLVLSLLGLVLLALTSLVVAQGAPVDRPAPAIVGGPWINSQPLEPGALRGRVVFVEFWTYG